jgi:hypothetical protein
MDSLRPPDLILGNTGLHLNSYPKFIASTGPLLAVFGHQIGEAVARNQRSRRIILSSGGPAFLQTAAQGRRNSRIAGSSPPIAGGFNGRVRAKPLPETS